MTKRPHSPAVNSPPSKVPHTLSKPDASANRLAHRTFDTALFDELILVVFSYLSYSDLCSIQSTNRNWARLALDNQLWKSLYLAEYGRTRLRGVRARKGAQLGRDIKPLPERAATKIREEDIHEWKWMFKIGSNWRTGRCAVEQLNEYYLVDTDVNSDIIHQTHILLAGNLIITAPSTQSASPTITVLSPTRDTHRLHNISTGTNTSMCITALALDQSLSSSHTRHLRISSFLSTGEFSIFTIDHHSPSLSTCSLTYVPLLKTDRTTPIMQAVYHHPVIMTLSKSFKLSIYDLSDEGGGVRHVQTLSSFSSYPPTSIVVSQLGGMGNALKVVLVYTVPVYPSEWGVGATELIISLGGGGSTEGYATVTSSRTIRTFDVPSGWIDEHKLRLCQEQWGRRVGRVADTQTDGKWVVLAPAPSSSPPSPPSDSSPSSSSSPFRSTSFSNPLQLYRLSLPALPSLSTPKLTFVRNLYGPEVGVDRIWVADGRCVSLGVDGSIWVWDLEEVRTRSSIWIEGAEVAPGRPGVRNEKGTVVFDESRIVSAWNETVEVRRFDA